MTKSQRYTQEMFVRVRDFGAAHVERFPESSPGGAKFALVAAAVAAIDASMKDRELGRVRARGVKDSTRQAVFDYMKTLAKAARRFTRGDRDRNPFQLGNRRTPLAVELSTARAFLEEAGKREADFIALGLPSTFVTEFKELVDELSQAAQVRVNSKTLRAEAQAGVATAVRQGFEAVRDLEVIVEVATRQEPVLAAAWRAARRVEGVRPSSRAADTGTEVVVEPVAEPARALGDDVPATEPEGATSPAAPSPAGNVTTVEAPVLVLDKAS